MNNPHRPRRRRVLSLPLITFYGLGTILGAGIYVLVGKIAGLLLIIAVASPSLASLPARGCTPGGYLGADCCCP